MTISSLKSYLLFVAFIDFNLVIGVLKVNLRKDNRAINIV